MTIIHFSFQKYRLYQIDAIIIIFSFWKINDKRNHEIKMFWIWKVIGAIRAGWLQSYDNLMQSSDYKWTNVRRLQLRESKANEYVWAIVELSKIIFFPLCWQLL